MAAGRVDLTGEPTVRLSLLVLVRGHAGRFPKAADAVRARIGPPDTKPVVAEDVTRLLGSAELDPVGRYLLEACDGTKSVGALLASSPDRDEPTLRAIYGLLLAGLLERRTRRGGGARASRSRARSASSVSRSPPSPTTTASSASIARRSPPPSARPTTAWPGAITPTASVPDRSPTSWAWPRPTSPA